MTEEASTWTPNQWADFWRYQIGVNVMPANTKDKKPLKGLSWEQWQINPIPEELHKKWKEQNAFLKGIAIIPGKVWHREDKKDLYFTFLDADKQKAVDELCSRNGKATTLQEMAQKFIVEQYKDNLQKAHIYFYSPIPFPKKSSDSVLGLEVKGLGVHGIAYCTNSIHKVGQPYEITGTTNLITLTMDQAKQFIEHINQVCKKHNLEYLEKHYQNLLDSNSYIYQGERHKSLISIANSLLFKYGGDGNGNGNGSVAADSLDPRLEQQLKDKLVAINQNRCKPLPLPESELSQIWKDAVAYYTKKKNDDNYNKGGSGSDADQEESAAQKALRLAEDQCDELFHDQFNTPYAAVQVGSHIEVLPLKSSRFRNWLCRLYYEYVGNVLSGETASNIISVLKAKAEFEGSARKLNLRVASIKEEPFTIYYDLTDKNWSVIKITKYGWNVQDAPIIFRQYSNQQPQVYPREHSTRDIFDRFMNLINIKGEDNKLLLQCYIISLFYPEIPKPVLMLHGEQGGAKSTLQELIRMLVDPSSISTLTFPRDINELVQKLSHNYITYFDNVSLIPEWISDQLCRAVTGSGFSKRELYTDDDDIIYNFKRCIGFNGINLGATKADLLDRGIIIELERIPRDKQRRLEDIWAEFDAIKPELLGYIFDMLIKVLQVKSNGGIANEIKGLPRMADFAEIGEIISRCIGNENSKFLDAYYRNIDLQVEEAIASNPIGNAIIKLMERLEDKTRSYVTKEDCNSNWCSLSWKGTATELLADLEGVAAELKINTRQKPWPKAPNTLSRRINEVKTNLREIGITIDKYFLDHKTKARGIKICKVSSEPSEPSETKNHAQFASDISDDTFGNLMIVSSDDKVSSDKMPQNRAQNSMSDDKDDTDDILHTLKGPCSEYPPICYYCDYKPDSKDNYEKIEPVISSIRRLLHNEGATEIKTWTLPDRKKSNEPDVIFEFIVPNETCLEHIESLLKKEYSIDNLYMFVSE